MVPRAEAEATRQNEIYETCEERKTDHLHRPAHAWMGLTQIIYNAVQGTHGL